MLSFLYLFNYISFTQIWKHLWFCMSGKKFTVQMSLLHFLHPLMQWSGGRLLRWMRQVPFNHFVESIHYSDHFVDIVITLMETFDEVSFITYELDQLDDFWRSDFRQSDQSPNEKCENILIIFSRQRLEAMLKSWRALLLGPVSLWRQSQPLTS